MEKGSPGGHAQLSLGVRENLIQKCKESREWSRQETGPADPGQWLSEGGAWGSHGYFTAVFDRVLQGSRWPALADPDYTQYCLPTNICKCWAQHLWWTFMLEDCFQLCICCFQQMIHVHCLGDRHGRAQTLALETLCVYCNRGKIVYILYALNYIFYVCFA